MTLLEGAAEVARFLEHEDIPYFLIGGLAVQQWGEPRMTRDVDITVLVPSEELPAAVDSVLAAFPPRITDARAFALRHRVLLVEVEGEVPVDISLGIPGYEEEAVQRARWVHVPKGERLRMVSPEDLIIHKCVAGRPRDVEDVEGVLIRQRMAVDMHLIRRWLGEFQPLVDKHDPLELFDHARSQAEWALENPSP
ncbi:MAG: DUF6036 family nucleotidyltransferase [Candidatus Bipolaricaulota bacterium]